jgi:hypothetical protein
VSFFVGLFKPKKIRKKQSEPAKWVQDFKKAARQATPARRKASRVIMETVRF